MRRNFLAFVLSFLLLGMQQEVAVHALQHLGARQEQGATAPHQGVPCVTCELLASGTDGVPASSHWTGAAFDCAPVAPVAFATRAVAAPAGYSPRAPPAFS